MFFDVRTRAKQALFFAAPEADPNRAAQLDASCLQNAHGFEHHGRPGAVVGRARARVP